MIARWLALLLLALQTLTRVFNLCNRGMQEIQVICTSSSHCLFAISLIISQQHLPEHPIVVSQFRQSDLYPVESHGGRK